MKQQLFEYKFHRESWDSYEELDKALQENRGRPSEFNLGRELVQHPFELASETAIIAHAEDGTVEEYSYAQLRSEAARIASYLREQGIQQGDRIGINLPQRPETIFAHIAAWMIGAIPVPLSTLFGTDGLRYRLQDSGVTASFVDTRNTESFRSIRPDIESLSTVITVDEPNTQSDETRLEQVRADYTDRFTPQDRLIDDPATILYTSGSTGDPKGVVLPQGMVLGYLPTFVLYVCNLRVDGNKHWTPAEWAWSGSLYTTVFPTLFYGETVLAHLRERFDPAAAFKLIERHDLTNCHIPPAALHKMRELDGPGENYELSSVRVISSGGDTVGTSLIEWAESVFPNAAVHTGYGQTEALAATNDCLALYEPNRGSIGLETPGHEVAVLDLETHEPIDEPNEIGELAIRHENDPVCFTEYWNEEKKTAQKYHGPWLLTEDLGWQDEDGYFWFKGRKDDVIISSGYRIGPEEIEQTLESHSAVDEAAVVGVPDEARGEVPKAFVMFEEEPSDALKATLKQFVQDRLARHEYPRKIEAVDTLPKTITGKIQRSELTEETDNQ